MGIDCAPLLANLYLFYYEYNYMKNSLKFDYGKALKLKVRDMQKSIFFLHKSLFGMCN